MPPQLDTVRSLDSVVPDIVAGAVTNDSAAVLISGGLLVAEPGASRSPRRMGISMGDDGSERGEKTVGWGVVSDGATDGADR